MSDNAAPNRSSVPLVRSAQRPSAKGARFNGQLRRTGSSHSINSTDDRLAMVSPALSATPVQGAPAGLGDSYALIEENGEASEILHTSTKVKVTVVEARQLTRSNKPFARINAKCVVSVGHETRETIIMLGSNAPKFGETFEFTYPGEASTCTVNVTIFHKESTGTIEYIGQAIVPANGDLKGQWVTIVNGEKRKTGEVKLDLEVQEQHEPASEHKTTEHMTPTPAQAPVVPAVPVQSQSTPITSPAEVNGKREQVLQPVTAQAIEAVNVAPEAKATGQETPQAHETQRRATGSSFLDVIAEYTWTVYLLVFMATAVSCYFTRSRRTNYEIAVESGPSHTLTALGAGATIGQNFTFQIKDTETGLCLLGDKFGSCSRGTSQWNATYATAGTILKTANMWGQSCLTQKNTNKNESSLGLGACSATGAMGWNMIDGLLMRGAACVVVGRKNRATTKSCADGEATKLALVLEVPSFSEEPVVLETLDPLLR